MSRNDPTATYTPAQIEAIGGRRWTKGVNDRVYLDAETALGLRIQRYNSGSVRSASLDGEAVSNTRAAELAMVKVWLDCRTGVLNVNTGSARRGTITPDEALARAVATIDALLAG